MPRSLPSPPYPAFTRAARSLVRAAFVVAILFGCEPLAVRAADGDDDCVRTRNELKAHLANRFAGSASAARAEGTFIARHPLLATFSRDIYSRDGDIAFLRDAYAAATRYFDDVLAHADADGDLLIERSVNAAADPSVEDVGYNSMLALDMLSLAAICQTLHMPFKGLFWYQAHTALRSQIIRQTYDVASRYFLPVSNNSSYNRTIHALSALPVYFPAEIGDDVALSILRNYVLKRGWLLSDTTRTPADGMAGAWRADDLIRTVLLLGALERNGLSDTVPPILSQIAAQPRDDRTLTTGEAFAPYLECLLVAERPLDLFPRHLELDLLADVCESKNLIPNQDTEQLRRSTKILIAFDTAVAGKQIGSDGIVSGAEDANEAMQTVYWTISILRKRLQTRSLFPARARDQIPGFDVYSAFANLLDNVVEHLRESENRISTVRTAGDGFSIVATLKRVAVAPGEAVDVRLALSTRRPLRLRSLDITSDQSTHRLLGDNAPITLLPGEPAPEFTWHLVPRSPDARGLVPVHFTADVQLTGRPRLRYHFREGVSVSNPIDFTVSFPEGNILRGNRVPIDLHITKNMPGSMMLHTEWFSFAGLVLREGSSLETPLPKDTTHITLHMNVLVPTPCRPGAFPFLLKVFGDGAASGTITGKMFRHYQWIFLGPLPAGYDPLDTPYPPERAVNLRESYQGAGRGVSWATLPQSACDTNGEIDLAPLIPDDSVGYLYTVIKAGSARRTVIAFACGSPAIIFLNGETIVRAAPAIHEVQRFPVDIREGMNNILIKIASAGDGRLFFQLGDEDDLTSDEFDNNLWELIDGYEDFHNRTVGHFVDDGDVQQLITLSYNGSDANSVAVIGSFNGWSPVNSHMRETKPGHWVLSLHLAPGRYAYRFLINNSAHVLDPSSPLKEPDGYGGHNSVFFVR